MAAPTLQLKTRVTPPAEAHTAPALPSPPLTPTTRTVAGSLHDVAPPATAVQARTTESKQERRQRWLREAACYSSLFTAGWGDSSSGPLIPYIQEHFHISYTVVSMLFVGQMVGFLLSGFVNSWLSVKYGLGKVILGGALLQATAYALLVPAFPFPAFPVIYAVGGLGLALQDAQANVYVAGLPVNSEKKLGYLHGAYGLGGAVCPLAATAFAESGILFARFYAISLGLTLLSALLLLYAFKFSYRVDHDDPIEAAEPTEVPSTRTDVGGVDGIELAPASRRDSTVASSFIDGKEGLENQAEEGRVASPRLDTSLPASRRNTKSGWRNNILVETLSNRTTIFASIFTLLYVGSEVSMGGWVVTFMIDNRGGGASAGYVASGFWFGLMLGRFILPYLNIRIGEQRAVYIYLTLALALEFAIWFADTLVGNAVVVAIIGFIIGPLYPIVISVVSKVLPRRLHASVIAFIAAFGQTGSAIFPFITGALAQKFSPIALQPVMIVLFGCQLIAWLGVPRIGRKAE
ncbi:hypothetical protein JCM8097_007415 [Rhodosporidiobolus ruineniae]